MSTEQMQHIIKCFDAMFNIPDLSIAEGIFAPHFVAHTPMMLILNRSSFTGFIGGFYDAFSDFIMEINDRIVTDDRLVLRVTYYGTHNGNFVGIAGTGRLITMPAICIFRIENDQVVENWMEIDVFDAIRQISELPADGFLQSKN
jgi:predicted ester cyclase